MCFFSFHTCPCTQQLLQPYVQEILAHNNNYIIWPKKNMVLWTLEFFFDIAEREGTHWLFFSTLGILLGDI